MSQQSRHLNCRSLSCASRKKCKKKSRSVNSVLRCVSFKGQMITSGTLCIAVQDCLTLFWAKTGRNLASAARLPMQVYVTLQQHALSDSQHALIMPAHMLGQSETKRQQLRRALHHQRAGIALPEGSQLERERHVETAELDPMSAAQVSSTCNKSLALHMKGFVDINSTSLTMQSKSQSCLLPVLTAYFCTFAYSGRHVCQTYSSMLYG